MTALSKKADTDSLLENSKKPVSFILPSTDLVRDERAKYLNKLGNHKSQTVIIRGEHNAN